MSDLKRFFVSVAHFHMALKTCIIWAIPSSPPFIIYNFLINCSAGQATRGQAFRSKSSPCPQPHAAAGFALQSLLRGSDLEQVCISKQCPLSIYAACRITVYKLLYVIFEKVKLKANKEISDMPDFRNIWTCLISNC